MSKHVCDCGAVYSHPDQLIRCAENRHWAPADQPEIVSSSPAAEPVAVVRICERSSSGIYAEVDLLRFVDSGTRLYAVPVELDALRSTLTRVTAERDELLAACQEAITSGLEDMHPESVRIIQAAIAKAEGRS